MTRAIDVMEAFALLREMCDPRGHNLLTALENLCIVDSVALDGILQATELLLTPPPGVVSRIEDYSVRVK